MPLGGVELLELTYGGPLRPERTSRLVRRSDPELYVLVCPALVGPREMVLFDSALPLAPWSGALVLRFPKRSLRLPPHRVRRLLAVPIPAGSGCGRLLSQLLAGIAQEYVDCSPPELIRLGQTALDLTTAVLNRGVDAAPSPPHASRPRTLFLAIAAHVDRNLGDPGLSPAAIARAHGISLRYVQRIFQEQGTTAAAFIRTQRLTRCRRDLTDPALHHIPVHAIGARWGFPRPSDFNRVFRATVGVSPGRYRKGAAT
ncbi:helix-turn-helix domain-containing protein [Streptomyces sp. NPDC059568]|uniref:helix-turn-helix domain-containing protein n=1 Tax=Streptomyces sp. NPDC059568 TaxID=3346868 RepID=UPI00369ECDCF